MAIQLMDKHPDLALHPIRFLRTIESRYGSGVLLRFSRYLYRPKSRVDERVSFEMSISQVDEGWLLREFEGLGARYELAIESRVKVGRETRHIPMLDFRGMTKGQLLAIMEVFPKELVEGVDVYFSGRSFHAYFPSLLTSRQWVKFMGSSLLCNTPSDPSVVDQRWVGHRLVSGFSALRWSSNTPHYKQYPERVDPATLNESFNEKMRMLR